MNDLTVHPEETENTLGMAITIYHIRRNGALVADVYDEDLAKLFVVSPNLLKVCEALVAAYDRVGGPLAVDPEVASARAVLAKVKP